MSDGQEVVQDTRVQRSNRDQYRLHLKLLKHMCKTPPFWPTAIMQVAGGGGGGKH